MSMIVRKGTVDIPATSVPFYARSRFVISEREDVTVKISQLGVNFQEWFLEKREAPFEGSTLAWGENPSPLPMGPAFEFLGGDAAAVSLTEFYLLIAMTGESGPLLVNGWGSVFLIPAADYVLRAVTARRFRTPGWILSAYDRNYPDDLAPNSRFFWRVPR